MTTTTFDATRLTAKLAAARAGAAPVIAELLPGIATLSLLIAGYLDPGEGETGVIEPEQVLTDPSTDGPLTALGILTVYDWVLDPDAKHCSDAAGLDCPTLAAEGPYLASFSVRPGDGQTPCGQKCRCQFIARELDLADAASGPLQDLAAALRLRLANAWKEG